MLEKFKSKIILYPTAIMVAICIIVTLALSGTNLLTEKKIEKINAKNEAAAMKSVINAKSYCEKVTDSGSHYFVASNSDEVLGYIFKMTEKGYGGDVSVMIGIDTELKVIGVEVTDVSNETPGLGQNSKDAKFTKQFKGKSEPVKVKKFGTATADNEIDAVASATITSTAVTNAVNNALTIAKEISPNDKEGGNAK